MLAPEKEAVFSKHFQEPRIISLRPFPKVVIYAGLSMSLSQAMALSMDQVEAKEKAVIEKRTTSMLKRSVTWSDSMIEERENSPTDEDAYEENVIAVYSAGVGEDMDVTDESPRCADVIAEGPDVGEDMDTTEEDQVYECQIRRKTEDAAVVDNDSSQAVQLPRIRSKVLHFVLVALVFVVIWRLLVLEGTSGCSLFDKLVR